MKQRYTLPQLLAASAQELNINEMDLETVKGSGQRATECRYIVFHLMEKDGHTHNEIAAFFKVSRETVTRGLSTLDDWMRIYKDLKANCNRCLIKLLP